MRLQVCITTLGLGSIFKALSWSQCTRKLKAFKNPIKQNKVWWNKTKLSSFFWKPTLGMANPLNWKERKTQDNPQSLGPQIRSPSDAHCGAGTAAPFNIFEETGNLTFLGVMSLASLTVMENHQPKNRRNKKWQEAITEAPAFSLESESLSPLCWVFKRNVSKLHVPTSQYITQWIRRYRMHGSKKLRLQQHSDHKGRGRKTLGNKETGMADFVWTLEFALHG